MSNHLEQARLRRDADIVALANLDADQLHYLGHLDELPDPSGEGVEHDDQPHLTEEEWAYIAEVADG